jgi:Na+/proline symporter/signal transduction histidine kinase
MLSSYFNLEYIILYIFLAITLVIGLRASRNIKDIRDYALAGKNFGVGALTMSFIAAYIDSSEVISNQRSILRYGLVHFIPKISTFLAFVLFGIYLVPRLVKNFKGCLTLGDVIAKIYGNYAGILTAIASTYYTIFILASQLVAIGHVFHIFLGWPIIETTIYIGIIIIFYSSIGGIKSITATDVFKFVIFVVAISIICNLAVSKAGGIKTLIYKLPKSHLSLLANKRFSYYCLGAVIWSLAVSIYPASVQRLLMAKNAKDASNIMILSGVFIFVLTIIMTLGTLAVLVINPDIQPGYAAAFKYIIDSYLGPKLKMLSVLGIVSIIMATADNVLNTGSLILSHNLITPILSKYKVYADELKIVKYTSFIIGFLALFMSLIYPEEIAKLVYVSVSLLLAICVIPFVSGVMGLKGDSTTFIASALSGLITFIFVSFFLKIDLHPTMSNDKLAIPVAMFNNALVFFTIHLIKNKGFAIAQYDSVKSGTITLIKTRIIAGKLINSLIQLPTKISYHLKEQMNNYELSHVSFGLFMSLNYMMPYFLSDNASINNIFTLKLIGACLCVGLLLQPYWSTYFYDKFFHLYWNLTLLYCLPFSTSLFYILNNGNTLWSVNLAFSIMLLMALVDWKSFIIIIMTGTLLAMSYTNKIIMIPQTSYEQEYDWAYIVFYAVCISLLFVRRRQKNTESKIKTFENKVKISGVVASATSHEVTDELNEAFAAAQTIDIMRRQGNFKHTKIGGEEGYFINNNLYDKIIQLYPAVQEAANRIKITTLMFRNAIKGFDLALENEKLSMRSLINEALKGLYLTERRKTKLHLDLNADFEFMGDLRMFKHVIWNLLKNIYKHSGTEEVFIWLERDSKKEYNEVHIKDHGIGIKPENLHKIFELFFTTGNSENSTGIGLSLCKTIIEKLGGNIRCESKQGEGSYTEFIISLPKM